MELVRDFSKVHVVYVQVSAFTHYYTKSTVEKRTLVSLFRIVATVYYTSIDDELVLLRLEMVIKSSQKPFVHMPYKRGLIMPGE